VAEDDLVLDLSRLETSLLVESVRRPAAQPFGLYAFAGNEPGAQLGRTVERTVFGQAFGDSPELLAAEYDPYDPASLFFVVIDHRRAVPCGTARVIVPNERGLKTLNDVETQWGIGVEELQRLEPGAFDTRAMWDLATQAVVPEYQGKAKTGLVTAALYHGIVLGSVLAGTRRWVAVMDDAVLRMMNIFWKRPFAPVTGLDPRPYLGSASSTIAWTDVDAWRARFAEADPLRYEELHTLENDPVVSMPDWDEVQQRLLQLTDGATVSEGASRLR
jgi:hypothetical protein